MRRRSTSQPTAAPEDQKLTKLGEDVIANCLSSNGEAMTDDMKGKSEWQQQRHELPEKIT